MEYSLEEAARTSDDEAIRNEFARRNLVAVRVVSVLFVIGALPVFGTSLGSAAWLRAAAAFAALALSGFAFYVAMGRGREHPLIARLRRHVTSATIVYCLIAVVLNMAVARTRSNFTIAAALTPLMLVGFRMLTAELIVFHGALIAVTATRAVLLLSEGKEVAGVIVAAACVNLFAFGIELSLSRRMKKRIVREWSERRFSAREQLRMRDELRYAREIQLSMLPDREPAVSWADIAGVSLPATEVGGDYYDYFDVDGKLAIVSGDVAGHGFASGIVLASLRSGFTLLRDSLADPAAVLQRLHTMVAETARRRTFVTCAVLLLDPKARRAVIASAGHPPLIVRRASGEVERIELWAPPLGVRLPVHVPQCVVEFAPGDIFVMHTDGVYEARNEYDESYGIERLEEAVTGLAVADAATMRNGIITNVERFRAGAAQDDDITVVVAKML